jgi:hypothetical protein
LGRVDRKKRADEDEHDDDEHYQSGHDGGFCRRDKPLYSPFW